MGKRVFTFPLSSLDQNTYKLNTPLFPRLLRRYILRPFEAWPFPLRGNHHGQGNVQVYNVRIPVSPPKSIYFSFPKDKFQEGCNLWDACPWLASWNALVTMQHTAGLSFSGRGVYATTTLRTLSRQPLLQRTHIPLRRGST